MGAEGGYLGFVLEVPQEDFYYLIVLITQF